MSHITLAEAKQQLSIDESDSSQDAHIERLIRAAETWAKNFLNADSLEDYLDSPYLDSPADSPATGTLPEDLKDGILLQLEASFDRDERNMRLLIERAEQILFPYRQKLGV